MIMVNMAVTVDTVDELIEALKSAGPNVASFYGEVRGFTEAAPATVIPEEPVKEDPPEESVKEDPPKDPTPVYSMVEVRGELAKVRELHGSDRMREVLRKFGADKLADIAPDKYPAIMKEVEEILSAS